MRVSQLPPPTNPGFAASPARAMVTRRRRVGARTQEERSADAQAALMEVAVAKIGAKGLAFVTMAEIADEAGLTRGAIQHHFGTRDHFIRAVLRRLTDHVDDRLKALPEPAHSDWTARIAECVEAITEIILSSELLAIVDISISSRAEPALTGETRATSTRLVRAFLEVWHQHLAGIADEADLGRAFKLFTTFMSGLLVVNYGRVDPKAYRMEIAMCTEVVTGMLRGGGESPADGAAPFERARSA